MSKKDHRGKDVQDSSFERFEVLARNLISVSNAEVREKMAEEKRKKSKKGKPAK